jgi:hypothetical protein
MKLPEMLQYLESNCLNFEFVYTNDIVFHRKVTKLHGFVQILCEILFS